MPDLLRVCWFDIQKNEINDRVGTIVALFFEFRLIAVFSINTPFVLLSFWMSTFFLVFRRIGVECYGS